MKTCTKCHQPKPEGEFHRHRDGTRPDCKTCANAASRARDAVKKPPRTDADREAWRRHYEAHKDRRLQQYRTDTARLSDAYVRKKLVRGTELRVEELPQALVDLKREHLRLLRSLKEQ